MSVTPGPYSIQRQDNDGYRVTGIGGITIAWFGTGGMYGRDGSYTIGIEECKRNAEVFYKALMEKKGAK